MIIFSTSGSTRAATRRVRCAEQCSDLISNYCHYLSFIVLYLGTVLFGLSLSLLRLENYNGECLLSTHL